MNSNSDGFLIPDQTVQADDLAAEVRGVKRSLDTIIELLKAQSGSDVLRRSLVRAQDGPDSGGPSRDSTTDTLRQLTRQQAQQAAADARQARAERNRNGGVEADERTRDERGRFNSGDTGDDDDKSKDGLVARLKAAMPGGGVGEVDKLDPAIEAANEMKGMVGTAITGLKSVGDLGHAVIGRGATGAKDKATPWYRRFLQQMKLMRKDDGEFHRAELRAQDRAGAGGDSGGGIISEVLKTLFSPVGVAIIGAIALAWKTIGTSITSAWTDLLGGISKSWDDAVAQFKAIWAPIGKFLADKFGIVETLAVNAGNVANEAVKSATGFDAKVAVKAVKARAGVALENVASSASVAKDWAGEKIASGKDAAGKMFSPVSRLIASVGTKRTYERQDGATEQREGGSVSWRNNNPGNLKFGYADSADKTSVVKRTKAQALSAAKKSYGPSVVDLDQWGNAIFTTEDAGRAAQAQLLKKTHGEKTIEQMLPKYAITDYSGKADTDAYAKGIHKSADAKGVALRGKKIGDMSEIEINTLLDGMKKVEGFKVGSAQVTGAPAAVNRAVDDAKLDGSKSGSALITGAPGVVNRTVYDAKLNGLKSGSALVTGTPAGPSPVSAPLVAPALSMSGAFKLPSVSLSAPPPVPPMPRDIAPVQLSKKEPLEVTVRNDQLANQDVKDRRLAHIATGGISNN
jgi:hypothetical protein